MERFKKYETEVNAFAASVAAIDGKDVLTLEVAANALASLAHVTDDKGMALKAVSLAKKANNDTTAGGNVLLTAGDEANKESVLKKAELLKSEETKDGKFAYERLVFFMNYETKLGGMERYNGIYKAFADTETTDALDTALYMAACVDAASIMNQMVYEYFDGCLKCFKAAYINFAAEKNEETGLYGDSKAATLIGAYAILKACRLKGLLSEKHAEEGYAGFEAAISKGDYSDFEKAAAVLAYAEGLRNRDYQDYGRANGGVLWS